MHGTGPLAVWRALAVNRNGNRSQVGLTADGWDLLEIVEGMTIEQPHDADVAARFLAHIFRIHPGERWGFTHLLQVLASDNADGPNWPSPSLRHATGQSRLLSSPHRTTSHEPASGGLSI